jgi:ComF family protein
MQITAIRCYAAYDRSLKKAILSLKYHRNISLGESLASHLISLLNDLGWEIELVVPVPLSTLRYSERGYNQASLLGRPLAMAQNLDYDTSVLKKIVDTPSQVSLPLDRRLHNLKNAFYADTGKASGKSILIVDDVVTSGATMEACASALFAAEASSVFGLALARA